MANIFTLDNNEGFSEHLNIDDLYEKKKSYDLSRLELYNKMLHRIHVRIKAIANQKIDEQLCWYIVPEIMIGISRYDQGACIAYLMDKLKESKFLVKYIHPNLLMIGWAHWVPAYVRSELKKKTGIEIDEFGAKILPSTLSLSLSTEVCKTTAPAPPMAMTTRFTPGIMESSNSSNGFLKKSYDPNTFTPISSYKPEGNLVYARNIFSKLDSVKK